MKIYRNTRENSVDFSARSFNKSCVGEGNGDHQILWPQGCFSPLLVLSIARSSPRIFIASNSMFD